MNKTIEKYVGQSYGTPAPGNRISINTPLAAMQRPLNQKKVEEYIAKSEGVDWNLFGYATAVRFPSGEVEVINGQHRMHLIKLVLPECEQVPAHVIDVTDAEYAAKLFDKMNGGASAALKSQEKFFAQIHAKDKYALHLEAVLKKTNFCVGKVNAGPSKREIKYANFVKCVKFSEVAFLQAAHVIDTVWPTGAVNDNVLSGMSRLFSLEPYRKMGDPSTAIGRHFVEWLYNFKNFGGSMKSLEFKKLRNSGPWFDASAYGIARLFFKRERREGRQTPKLETIKKIWESHVKDDDSDSLEMM